MAETVKDSSIKPIKKERNDVKPIIELNNVTHKYPNGTKALKNVSFKIEPGEFVFVVGPSGAGKSTLTKLLMLEERIHSGSLYVCGYDLKRLPSFRIPHLRRKIGMVFQDYRLLENFTVFENVALALHVVGERKKLIKTRVHDLLKLVGIADKADSLPSELSGGERQRVAFARALANAPQVVVADEPTGNVDPVLTRVIMEILQKINNKGITTIMVTHNKDLVDKYKKRVISISNGKLNRDSEGGMFDENKVP